jgi:hypothetical protein
MDTEAGDGSHACHDDTEHERRRMQPEMRGDEQALKRTQSRGEVSVGFIGLDGVIYRPENRGRVSAFDASRGGCIPSPKR